MNLSDKGNPVEAGTMSRNNPHFETEGKHIGEQPSLRTFLVWRYNTTKKALMSETPIVVHAESAQAVSDRFYRQALVVEAHVSLPQSPPDPEPVSEDSPGVRVPRSSPERPQEGET